MTERVRWTEDKIRQIAPQFSSRTEMSRGDRGAYRFANQIPGLLDELFGNQKFVWTEDALIKEAQQYQSKGAFKRGSGGAYVVCISRFPGLIDSLFDNKIRYWTDEASVREEASRYASRVEFRNGCPGASKSAIAKFPHILDELFGPKKAIEWTLPNLIAEAKKFPSRQIFISSSGGAYNAFNRFPGELDKLFPKKYRYWGNENDVRDEARKYTTKAEFICGCVSAYGAALNMGIIDDLGFEPSKFGFDSSSPAHLYVVSLNLMDGTQSTMFGITNRTPKQRYKLKERNLMQDRITYKFPRGGDALKLETLLRREFKEFSAEEGQSPLLFKKGTAGEILRNVPLEFVTEMLKEYSGEYLPTPEPW